MGIFSSKKTVTVSARTMHLIDSPKDPYSSAVLGAVIREESIPMALLNLIHSSLAVSIPHIYNYAKDEYTLGLPQGNALNSSYVELDHIDEILLLEKGNAPPLRCEGATFMNVTPAIAVYPHLYNIRQWNQFTNLVELPPAGIVWQQDPEVGSLQMSKARKEVRLKSAVVANDGVSIDLVYALLVERPVVIITGEDGDRQTAIIENRFIEEPYSFTENVPYPDAPLVTWGEEFLVTIYREYNETGITPISGNKAWVYRVSSGIYPNVSLTKEAVPNEYFPVIPLRYYNFDLMEDQFKNTPLYITSRKLGKIAKMDLDVLAERLNANPNVADIDHAYIMHGINIRTEVPACLLYLHTYFQQLYEIQFSDHLEYQDKLGRIPLYGTGPINSVGSNSPTSTFMEHGLLVYLDYDYITSEVEPYIIGNGKVGNVSKEYFTYSEEPKTDLTTFVINDKAGLTLKLQVEPGQVHTLKIYGLEHRNMIYDFKCEVTSLLDVINDPDENNLVIPLQFKLIQDMTLRHRMMVFPDAVLMIINTYQVTEGKWYTSGWFQVIMVIIAVIIVVVACMFGQAWVAELVAKGYLLWQAVGIVVLVNVLASIAVTLTANYLVKTFGAQWGIVATIILVIAAVVLSGGSGAAGAAEQFMMITAQTCLQMGAAIISASNEFLIEAGAKIKTEYEAFTKELSERYEDLKTSTDLLEMGADIDPLLFIKPARLKIVPNESPDQFYSRCLELPAYTMFTVHDQIPTYFDKLLKLPRTAPKNMYATAI